MNNRRKFIKQAVTGTAALSIGGILPGFTAKSYGSIIGANERIRVANMGVNARGFAVASNFSLQPNCEVIYVCDVDKRAAAKCVKQVEKNQKKSTINQPDFRKALEDKTLDALVVTAPDHWHAPAAIMALKAGKHVYLEKPIGHNPNEGELLISAVDKYKKIIQVGNQRRSWPNVVAGINEVHSGAIGKAYYAKTWYTNNRQSIGVGKEVAVPEWLDFELWQGPAPRKAYKDNLIHYNWHWFKHWGTGEALNNGTHQVDLARWGLNVGYPTKVGSVGGRYAYSDDWEFPDTQVISMEFDNKASITWEGRSCNGKGQEGHATGVIFYGDKGSLMIINNSYTIYDLKGTIVKYVEDNKSVDTLNTLSPSQALDAFHIQNFFSCIKDGKKTHSEIVGAHQSTILCQLGNISQFVGESLNIDNKNGRILNNKNAQKYWSREYEKGWEPKI